MIVAVFVSDRGDLYLPDCLASFEEKHAASGVLTHVVDDRDHKLGMAGAVRAGFEWALSTDCSYVLWVEEDFLLHKLPLGGMRKVLDLNPGLAQVVLKRQPWSAEEKAAGGQIEVDPAAYTQCAQDGVQWVEHTRLFSLNPCLIPRRTLELGVPVGDPRGFEAAFTERCRLAGLRFAYYGHRNDPARCEHVGSVRAGAGWSW